MKFTLAAKLLILFSLCSEMQASENPSFCDRLCSAIKNDDQVGIEELFKEPNSTWKLEYALSNQKLDPNVKSEKSLTSNCHALIHWAVRANNGDILEVLLNNQRTHVDIENANGSTALGFAVALGRVRATSALLEHGANPNSITGKKISESSDNRHSLLDTAIMYYSTSTSKRDDYYKVIGLLLFNTKTDPNIQDELGKTPLHYAVSLGGKKIVELLLQNSKISRNIADKDCKTPLDYARELKNKDIEALLLNDKAK